MITWLENLTLLQLVLVLLPIAAAAAVLIWWSSRTNARAATPTQPPAEPARPDGLSAAERAVLRYIARRASTGPERAHAIRLADGMRTSFPELDDVQLARQMIRVREILLTRHERGMNAVQIARLIGLIASELAALERETSPR